MPLRILDGGMGKYLLRKGLPNDNLWSAKSIIDNKFHDMVINAHFEYLCAGSQIITTNNYSLTPRYLRPIHCLNKIQEWTKVAVDLALQAKQKYYSFRGETDNILIAGSIPPLMKSYRDDLRLNEAESIKYYKLIIQALNDGGVDIMLCETMSCVEEVIIILKVLNMLNINHKEIWCSFALNDNGCLRSKETINDAIKHICIAKNKYKLNVTTISINCCLVEAVDSGFKQIVNDEHTLELLENNCLKIGLYPNAMESITFRNEADGGWHIHSIREEITPKIYYHQFVKRWLNDKKYQNIIGVIGGCCGVEPSHIQYIHTNIYKDFPQLINKNSLKSKL